MVAQAVRIPLDDSDFVDGANVKQVFDEKKLLSAAVFDLSREELRFRRGYARGRFAARGRLLGPSGRTVGRLVSGVKLERGSADQQRHSIHQQRRTGRRYPVR